MMTQAETLLFSRERLDMDQCCKSTRISWSSLPPELLGEISSRIANFGDHVCFRSVCSSWRSAARPRRAPPQPPLLIIAPYQLTNGSCDLFSFSGRVIHHLELPSAVSRHCHGSSHGWLFLQHDISFVSLVNPFTRAEIHLPPLPETAFISKALLSSDPSLDPESVALVVLQYNTFAFCKVGGESWAITENTEWSFDRIEDMVFYKGAVHVVGANGKLGFCHVSPKAALAVIPYVGAFKKSEKIYLMESCDDLYLVTRHMSWDSLLLRNRTARFDVFKLELVDRWRLYPIRDLKNDAFFLGPNQSMCLATKDLNGLDANCIYYVEEHQVDGYVNDIEPAVWRYSLSNRNIERLQDMNRYFFSPPESQWIAPSVTL